MFEQELEDLKKGNLIRRLISRTSAQGPVVCIEGREYVNFASNDYLGFAGRPEISESLKRATGRYGFGSGASRLLAGGTDLHRKLETAIAEFKSAESSLVFNSGYAANTGIIPALASAGDAIFSDELNHASIIDGCRLSRAKTVVFRHKDVDHLETLMNREPARRRFVVIDSVFSMDGDIAPLREIHEVCRKHDAVLYVDDAHGTGVLGRGKGALSHFNIEPDPGVIQMGTFSKALGSFGAFAAGSAAVTDWLTNSARSFIFSTALPACVISASLAALELLKSDEKPLKTLWSNRELLVGRLKSMGYDMTGSQTPIIPLRIGDITETLRLADFLSQNGIYAPAIRPPSVRQPRIRLAVSAGHTEDHIGKLIDLMKRFRSRRNHTAGMT
ncbi:MAG: 8-amino-7-oxononanoate synthase [Candidatus Sulfobium sp.]